MLTILLFFAWGVVAALWRQIGQVVIARSGSVVLGLVFGGFCLLSAKVLIEDWKHSPSPLAPATIAFLVGVTSEASFREWRNGTSRTDIALAAATVGLLFCLWTFSVR